MKHEAFIDAVRDRLGTAVDGAVTIKKRNTSSALALVTDDARYQVSTFDDWYDVTLSGDHYEYLGSGKVAGKGAVAECVGHITKMEADFAAEEAFRDGWDESDQAEIIGAKLPSGAVT